MHCLEHGISFWSLYIKNIILRFPIIRDPHAKDPSVIYHCAISIHDPEGCFSGRNFIIHQNVRCNYLFSMSTIITSRRVIKSRHD